MKDTWNLQKKQRLLKGIIKGCFIVYLIILLRITVFRSTFDFHHLFVNGKVNFTFFQGYLSMIKQGNWFQFSYLFLGNIIWFVPFGMYFAYAGKEKKALWITLAGFFLSLIIETLQYIFGTGYSELDDLILNTFGAWLGQAFFSLEKILDAWKKKFLV